MSELTPSLIPLDKGLNLQTAKLVAPPGSVLDTLNYEQVDFQGQKRIDGFVRYDGSLLSTIDDYYIITLAEDYAGALGSYVSRLPADAATEDWVEGDGLFGTVVYKDENVIHVAVLNDNEIPEATDIVFRLIGPSDANSVVSVVKGLDSGVSVEDHYQNLLTYNALLRSFVESLPGPVIGLHWFRDRLYAVADVTVASLDGITPIIYPNDVLTIAGDTDVKVLDSFVRDNTRLVFLSTQTPAEWENAGDEVFRDGDSVGLISNGFEGLNRSEEIASFFESRSEAQVIAEDDTTKDYGWRFVDQGWTVNFEDGLSLFGSLPSLNQNITGLGVQGPTSTADDNGVPLVLTQKINTTNTPVQVNGWKSSQTPNTYELETDNLIDIDDDTIYADAYISWNGTTGEVVGYAEPLVEYPATNTVEIEL